MTSVCLIITENFPEKKNLRRNKIKEQSLLQNTFHNVFYHLSQMKLLTYTAVCSRYLGQDKRARSDSEECSDKP